MATINPETGLSHQNKSGYRHGTYEWYRNVNLKRKYGITLGDWNSLFQSQDSKCAICSSTDPRGKNWHTDHCHQTGKIRSILCGWCNTSIGKMQEDPDLMMTSAIYILVKNQSHKGGVQDLKKARHFLDLLIEYEESRS